MIKKIDMAELRPGMYACGVERPGSGSVLFFTNSMLIKKEDIEKFSLTGYQYVYIDDITISRHAPAPPGPAPLKTEAVKAIEEPEKPREKTPEEPVAANVISDAGCIAPEVLAINAAAMENTANSAKNKVSFEAELKNAKKIRVEAVGLVSKFMHDVKTGKAIEATNIKETVYRMVESVFNNSDALTSLARLKDFDEYTYTHCVNVSILSIALGRQMGLERKAIEHLGTGAIIHDIGKMLVPEDIFRKPASLTLYEFEEMMQHTLHGARVLSSHDGIDESSTQVVLAHHEKYDGTGYPNKLRGNEIHLFARIAAVADTYDAMTSKRVYHGALLPEHALSKIFILKGRHFETEIVERLIRCIGIYSIGTTVELNTGEIGVVVRQNSDYPLRPVVMLLLQRNRLQYKNPIELDLKADEDASIIGARNPSLFGIDPDKYLQ